MKTTALFLVTHGSRDRRSWLALQNLVTLAQSQNDRYIGGGCLEGLPLTLAEQLVEFAIGAIAMNISEIAILPMLLLAGIHVNEDIPKEVAIAQAEIQAKFPDRVLWRTTPHFGTHPQIPNLLWQHFEKYTGDRDPKQQARILVSHGSRRMEANQSIEDLAKYNHAIAAYWGLEPKIETQIENLLAGGIYKINILPYFLTEGSTTEAIARKLLCYSDRAEVQLLPLPLSNQQIIDLSLTFN